MDRRRADPRYITFPSHVVALPLANQKTRLRKRYKKNQTAGLQGICAERLHDSRLVHVSTISMEHIPIIRNITDIRVKYL